MITGTSISTVNFYCTRFWAHLQKVGGEFKNFCMKSSTFNILLHFLQVFLSVLFLKKYQKRGQSCTAFDASFVQESLCDIFQSVHISSFAACRNAWGGKNSRCSNIMPPVSKHCSTALCASQRCPSALGGELPFATNLQSRTLLRTMVISKKHRHR